MDIKDSYLHGTVGVVKSISVSADKLKYTLADIAGTVKEVTLPVATTSANGLMSSGDKTKLDNLSTTLGNYVTLNTDQEITGTKTFTKQLKFTVAKGTAPFLVTSDTIINNLNADLLDGKHLTDFLHISDGEKNAFDLNTASMHKITALSWDSGSKEYITNRPDDAVGGTVITLPGTKGFQLYKPFGTNKLMFRDRYLSEWYSWKTIAFTDSNITGNAATADKLKIKRKLWGLSFDGSANVSGNMTGVGSIVASGTIHTPALYGLGPNGGSKLYFGIREGLALGIESYDKDGTWLNNGIQLFLDGSVSIGTSSKSEKLYVNGNVKATSFIGNLDGTYVNKLTGYSKATAIAALAATDTLNTALGKLEYKADVAYDLVKGAYDGDGTIENLAEILKVLEGIKDTETIKAIIGKYLPLTGGKLNSGTDTPLIILGTDHSWIEFKNSSNSNLGWIGVLSSKLPSFFSDKSYKIWHEGNDGSGSGLDADLLDGLHASYYATASSLGNYLPLAGGTMNNGAAITIQNKSNIIHTTASTSNAVTTIHWYKGSTHDTTYKYPACLGWHNIGGDGDGAIALVPYALDTAWWTGGVGLYIARTLLLFNNKYILHSGNYTLYVNSTNFPGLAGVRSVTINGNYLKVNTNGTDANLTINYATKANRSYYLETLYQDGSKWYGDSYKFYAQWGTSTILDLKCDGYSTRVDIARKIHSEIIVNAKKLDLSNVSWTATGYTFENLSSGTYAIQVTCGNLVASGIMSVYKNIDDTAMDEIPLHVYHDSTQPWRPYLRTSGKKLEISSNDASATSRTVTIKIALIL